VQNNAEQSSAHREVCKSCCDWFFLSGDSPNLPALVTKVSAKTPIHAPPSQTLRTVRKQMCVLKCADRQDISPWRACRHHTPHAAATTMHKLQNAESQKPVAMQHPRRLRCTRRHAQAPSHGVHIPLLINMLLTMDIRAIVDGM
jgi:hypothetical protein